MIAFLMQRKGDYNTWKYPDWIEGMRTSSLVKDTYYFDDGDTVIGSIEKGKIRICSTSTTP